MTLSLYETRSGTSSQYSSVCSSREKPRSNLFVYPDHTSCGVQHSLQQCPSLLSARPPEQRCSSLRVTLWARGRVRLPIPRRMNAKNAEADDWLRCLFKCSFTIHMGLKSGGQFILCPQPKKWGSCLPLSLSRVAPLLWDTVMVLHKLTSVRFLYTGWLKNWHHFVRLNFTEYWPIFKILSLSESGENLQ